jgi:Rrf2 family iron-sulfur cluster assembly transcriptional regulator
MEKTLTIPEISRGEGISEHVTAKILRALRLGGFIESARGHLGGYTLARPPKDILIGSVLKELGGKLYDESFCTSHSKGDLLCTITSDCTVRSLWVLIQNSVDTVLDGMNLSDMMKKNIILSA